jgi:uncharacterized membrane protein
MSKRHKREKASSGLPQDSSQPPVQDSKRTSPIDLVVFVLAVAGILLTAYLTFTASFEEHPAFCSEGSGCDIVQSSRWATFLGVPMALWGCLTYIVIAGLAWRARTKIGSWTPLIFFAFTGFAISAYLTAVSVIEIEATCPYCLASFGIITTIMILTMVRQPPDWLTSVKEAAIIAILIVGALHLHYSGIFDASAGPEDPQLQALAIHLEKTGVKFYGAYWCPRCQEQKAVFASSAKRLPYVECSSGGRGSALTAPCVKNDIKSYPTWIIGEQRLTGLVKPRELANASGFDWKE